MEGKAPAIVERDGPGRLIDIRELSPPQSPEFLKGHNKGIIIGYAAGCHKGRDTAREASHTNDGDKHANTSGNHTVVEPRAEASAVIKSPELSELEAANILIDIGTKVSARRTSTTSAFSPSPTLAGGNSRIASTNSNVGSKRKRQSTEEPRPIVRNPPSKANARSPQTHEPTSSGIQSGPVEPDFIIDLTGESPSPILSATDCTPDDKDNSSLEINGKRQRME
jgi:hypothetical protein